MLDQLNLEANSFAFFPSSKYLLFSIIEFSDEYISSKLLPSQISPVLLCWIASEAPPSLPPKDATAYCPASI